MITFPVSVLTLVAFAETMVSKICMHIHLCMIHGGGDSRSRVGLIVSCPMNQNLHFSVLRDWDIFVWGGC